MSARWCTRRRANSSGRRHRQAEHGGGLARPQHGCRAPGNIRFRRMRRPPNIDWDRFLGNAPKRPFEPIRLFRWRNYRDYGTAVAGDLFVHLLSGLHIATRSLGPTASMPPAACATGRTGATCPTSCWPCSTIREAGRAPRIQPGARVNFKSGVAEEQFGFRFVGSEGMMTTCMSGSRCRKRPPEREPGYTIGTFPKAVQEEFLREYQPEVSAAGTDDGRHGSRQRRELCPSGGTRCAPGTSRAFLRSDPRRPAFN